MSHEQEAVSSEKQASDIVLEQIGHKRDELLERLVLALQNDQRVKAAWLTGSFGRGEADDWSDLDIQVVVGDEHFEQIVAQPSQLFELAGEPLLVFGISGPSDSLPGGRFWLVMYAGAIEIDWNIGPSSKAERAEAAVVLFDRIGVPVAPFPSPISLEERRTLAERTLLFFWAMAPIAIKYAGRGHTRLAVKQANLLRDAYVSLWRVVHRPDLLQNQGYDQNRLIEDELNAQMPRFAATIDPPAALGNIRAFCTQVEQLHSALREFGVAIPDAMVGEVAALLERAEVVAQCGGSRPNQGRRR